MTSQNSEVGEAEGDPRGDVVQRPEVVRTAHCAGGSITTRWRQSAASRAARSESASTRPSSSETSGWVFSHLCLLFEEPEDPSNRSFFSEIISSVSDVKFSHSGRYMLTRDYLTVKVWDLNMEARPIETYQGGPTKAGPQKPPGQGPGSWRALSRPNASTFFWEASSRPGVVATPSSSLVSVQSPSVIMTGAYNNFFRMFDRNTKRDVTLEASRESSKPRAVLKPRRVCVGGKRRRDDISVDSLDFTRKILHTAWHPAENIIAIAATNNLYIFQDKVNSEMH
ncbi:serine/threonine-protein phosphatase 2A 55 kDa regulatory subunit B gamma isoform-like [Myotis lucifugus]|uniref:serine/threonine-protein phosphatase 2A 55 kDa regulatory subunit B gamma isoform-like n=1 Tax=Myotis lucifugus TaxID=59463 RepID=UPI000CCC6236|nr:serine/threonine-protein phosphatase 2A 55 kDa regulatory subunit B gamma isoform-like [Myotis lucifugus]